MPTFAIQMNHSTSYKQELSDSGFTTIDDIYSSEEVEQILSIINESDTSKDTFRKSTDLFAIRQFLKEIPAAVPLILNSKLKAAISLIMDGSFFIAKSIYFDKPASSNWYVSYHQDLTISVDKKFRLIILALGQ